jgi:hypothetical protein
MALAANGRSRTSTQPATRISSRFYPNEADRSDPFPWKKQRKKTSRWGAASAIKFAKALPVTAYAYRASAVATLSAWIARAARFASEIGEHMGRAS